MRSRPRITRSEHRLSGDRRPCLSGSAPTGRDAGCASADQASQLPGLLVNRPVSSTKETPPEILRRQRELIANEDLRLLLRGLLELLVGVLLILVDDAGQLGGFVILARLHQRDHLVD